MSTCLPSNCQSFEQDWHLATATATVILPNNKPIKFFHYAFGEHVTHSSRQQAFILMVPCLEILIKCRMTQVKHIQGQTNPSSIIFMQSTDHKFLHPGVHSIQQNIRIKFFLVYFKSNQSLAQGCYRMSTNLALWIAG